MDRCLADGRGRWITKTIEYQLILKSDKGIGRRIPPSLIAPLFKELPGVITQAILMAFEGRSMKSGRKPPWLRDASDIRFVDISGDEDTVLHFEAPILGDAASVLYQQTELWPTRPLPEDTGFDLLADVITDVAQNNADSFRYDPSLLRHLASFSHLVNGAFQEIDLIGHRYSQTPAVLNETTLQAAERLVAETPEPQRVRIVGTLDMVQESTQSFALDLETGERIRGILTEGKLTDVKMLFGQRVLVLGTAVYRPSGRVLRIDAQRLEPGASESSFWSRIPEPRKRTFDLREIRQPQSGTTGAAAIFGQWPGDETEEEILAALEEMS